MPASSVLDLSSLYRRPVFQSRTAVQSHNVLSRTISGHWLTWGRGSVNTALFRRDIGQISLMVLGYGAQVEIQADGFDGFALVQMPLQGAAEFISDDLRLTAVQGEVAILSPRKGVRTLWQAGCEQLILKVPHNLLANPVVVGMPTVRSEGPTCDSSLCLAPASKIASAVTPQWAALVQCLLNLPAPNEHGRLNPTWLPHFERTLALFLLSHQPPDDDSNDVGQWSRVTSVGALAEDLARGRLGRVRHYIDSRLDEPVSLSELAHAAGVGVRALNILCHRYYGDSPMVMLRNIRLDAARLKLVANPRASVTDIALAHGFNHFGRFSAYYRQRFGHLPRQAGSK